MIPATEKPDLTAKILHSLTSNGNSGEMVKDLCEQIIVKNRILPKINTKKSPILTLKNIQQRAAKFQKDLWEEIQEWVVKNEGDITEDLQTEVIEQGDFVLSKTKIEEKKMEDDQRELSLLVYNQIFQGMKNKVEEAVGENSEESMSDSDNEETKAQELSSLEELKKEIDDALENGEFVSILCL